MRGSPEYQAEVQAYRTKLKGHIRDFAEYVAGPLPRTFLSQTGCWLKAYVNYGESDFENIGRVYIKCTTPTHKYHPLVYVSTTLSSEMMTQFYHLRALYEMAGRKYSSFSAQFSTEEQRLAVLSRLLDEASELCQEHNTQNGYHIADSGSPSRIRSSSTPSSAPTTPPASSSTVDATPPPLTTTPSPILGKRKREVSSDGRKGRKRRATRKFPCPSPLRDPLHHYDDVSDGEYYL